MSIEQKIKLLLAYRGISQAELARRLGMSPANLNNKIKRGRLMLSDVERIANVMDANLTIRFEVDDIAF